MIGAVLCLELYCDLGCIVVVAVFWFGAGAVGARVVGTAVVVAAVVVASL